MMLYSLETDSVVKQSTRKNIKLDTNYSEIFRGFLWSIKEDPNMVS
jgi:hypothetical protein